MVCCEWSNATFTWAHYWHNFYFAPIIISHVSNCENNEKNVKSVDLLGTQVVTPHTKITFTTPEEHMQMIINLSTTFNTLLRNLENSGYKYQIHLESVPIRLQLQPKEKEVLPWKLLFPFFSLLWQKEKGPSLMYSIQHIHVDDSICQTSSL